MRRAPERRIVIVGAGGHAKVLADMIELAGAFALAGAVDPDPGAAERSGLSLLGPDEVLPRLLAEGVTCAAVGMGAVRDTRPRAALFARLAALGFELPALVHPKAVVARSARLGAGCQVMAGAVINPGAALGPDCVVNTGSIVEHDCGLGPHVFLGPGAALGGSVIVEEGAFIGMGAVVRQGVRVGARAVVGAGAAVTSDVPAGKTSLGVPASWGRKR